MALNGWIKVHRQLLEHWVSQEPELFAFWMRLLLEANHAEVRRMFNGSLITIERGQVVFGLEAFEAKSGISKKKLRRYLDLLQKEGMIGRQVTNKCSIISISNYNDYQEEGRQEAGKGQAEGKPRASQGQHRKNVKNGEKVKKRDIGSPGLDYSCWPDLPTDQVMADWLEMRKRKKANVTQTVINNFGKQMELAAKQGFSADDCLSECIVRNWTGFKAEWLKSGSGSKFTDPTRDTIGSDKIAELIKNVGVR